MKQCESDFLFSETNVFQVCMPRCQKPKRCINQQCVKPADPCDCKEQEFCLDGKCARVDVCEVGSNKHCPTTQNCTFNRQCNTYTCLPSSCGGGGGNGTCPPGQICRDGQCLVRCEEWVCPVGQECHGEPGGGGPRLCREKCCPRCHNGQICRHTFCQEKGCPGGGCDRGKVCKGGKCELNECEMVPPYKPCPEGFRCLKRQCASPLCDNSSRCEDKTLTCKDGKCLPNCTKQADCPMGFECESSSQLCRESDPPCHEPCPKWHKCIKGNCVIPPADHKMAKDNCPKGQTLDQEKGCVPAKCQGGSGCESDQV